MMRVCVCSHSDQQGWQTSVATFCPSSVGNGAKPSGGRFWPQRSHLISLDMDSSSLEFRVSGSISNRGRRRTTIMYALTRNSKLIMCVLTRNPKLGTRNLFLGVPDCLDYVVVFRAKQTEW